MRVDVRGPLAAARPTRGALVASLFAVVMIALVAFYSLSTEDDDVALDTEARIAANPSPRPTTSTTAGPVADAGEDESGNAAGDDRDGDGGPDRSRTVNYALSLGDVEGEALLRSGSTEAATATPTTQATTTTTAAPAAQTTVIDQSGSSTSLVDEEATGGDGAADPDDTTDTSTSDTTDTTAPAETTTTAAPSSDSDGFVDAGHGVLVPPVLLKIRFCESTDNYQAANPSSTARGAYQFLRSSWAAYGHADRYGVSEAHLASNAQQDEAALITWQRDGTRPWAASRSCWG